jgi:ribosomal protein L37AE/L43A
LDIDQEVTKDVSSCSVRQISEHNIEILIEGQECPFCHFARLKREGDEIVCPVCGYGHRACT